MNQMKPETMKMATPGTVTAAIPLPRVLGIPVAYDARMRSASECRGVGPWKKIFVGPQFLILSTGEKSAFLLHEAGHAKLWHIERLVFFILRNPLRLWAFLAANLRASRKFGRFGMPAEAYFHAEIVRRRPEIATYRKNQEYQADHFAAACGYGYDLISGFARIGVAGGAFHPDVESRIRRLIG